MTRGDVYDARLDPAEGSEQSGSRPVVIVTRNAINASSPTVTVAPLTTYRAGRRLYPSHVLVRSPEAGLAADSVILCEQLRTLDKRRPLRLRGGLTPATLHDLDAALLITLDLPGQP